MRLGSSRESARPTGTRRRSGLTASVAAAFALLTLLGSSTACGSDGDTSKATATSHTSASASVPNGRSSGPTTSIDPDATTTIPDLGGVTGPVSDCVKLSARFSNLVQGLLEGSDGATRSEQGAEALKSDLPVDLRDDADVVARTYGAIAANGGQPDGSGVDQAAYGSAVKAIGDWFAAGCKR